jgi:hypothetical protein
MPVFEGLKDRKEFLVMSVIIEFHKVKGARVESDGVNFAVGGVNGEDDSKSIIRGIHLKIWGSWWTINLRWRISDKTQWQASELICCWGPITRGLWWSCKHLGREKRNPIGPKEPCGKIGY